MENIEGKSQKLFAEITEAMAEVAEAKTGVMRRDDDPDLPKAIDQLNSKGGRLDRLLQMLAKHQVEEAIDNVRSALAQGVTNREGSRNIAEVAIDRFIDHLRLKANQAINPLQPIGRNAKYHKKDNTIVAVIDSANEQLKLSDFHWLSKRTRRLINTLNITTVNQLCEFTPERICASKNVGEITLMEIRSLLSTLGLSLKDDTAVQ